MTMSASKIFSFLRGALRGAYGQESLRDKRILIVGMGDLAQDLLAKLCVSDSHLFFTDPSVQNFYRAHTICGPVQPYQKADVDVIVDFTTDKITMRGKSFPLAEIRNDAYTHGIHEFYLSGKAVRENESGTQSDLGSPAKARVPGGNRGNRTTL